MFSRPDVHRLRAFGVAPGRDISDLRRKGIVRQVQYYETGDVDRRAIVVDRLNVAARFRAGVRHLANVGEYVEHAPVFFFTAGLARCGGAPVAGADSLIIGARPTYKAVLDPMIMRARWSRARARRGPAMATLTPPL